MLNFNDMGIFLKEVDEISQVFWAAEKIRLVIGGNNFDYSFLNVEEAKNFFTKVTSAIKGTSSPREPVSYAPSSIKGGVAAAIEALNREHGARNPKA